MRNRIKLFRDRETEHLITTFGRARLVCRADGTVELRGGEAEDKTSAKDWVSLFMHVAALRFEE